MSILPILVFLAITIKVCVDLIRHKTSRYIWVLTLAFVFVTAGTVHDLTIESHASALCADGTYSYSAHRRGTCSWHHGVVEWNPRIPPWWERFSK
ncbi:MAG: DUF3761 domain-containing protein [Rhizomicrobium sp.]